ncbi:hypothetical protein [Lentilactobacillus buchneri]|uniref:hypothetical protein n=1 Tax=Lentilactobacillus buchneri TaxID=1581 RepID=UPI0021A2BB27|nr:hypothetical protein [Lentilactobacillus buchneri]MCT2882630.1 hypothetical protein [Lentilactobacillus buchneri]
MKIKKSILLGIAALSFGGLISVNTISASARHYTRVPSSLQGTWYHYRSGKYSKLHATEYHFNAAGIHLSGASFPKYARGHSQMFVSKNSKGYYNIGKYATDEWPYWKKVTHKGRTALRELVFRGPGYDTYYWYQSKSIARHPSPNYLPPEKVYWLDDYDYAPSNLKKSVGMTVYTDESTSSDMPVELSSSLKDYDAMKYSAYIKHPGVELHLDKLTSSDGMGVGEVDYNGQTYYVAADSEYSAIVPYNTFRESGVVQSSCKPTDTANVVLKHGQQVLTNDLWEYFDPENGQETDYSYSNNKDKWYVVHL